MVIKLVLIVLVIIVILNNLEEILINNLGKQSESFNEKKLFEYNFNNQTTHLRYW